MDYNKQIELFELEDALAKLRDSSPGGDHIPYFLLRALPMKTKPKLISIYNQSFQQGEIPKARKLGIVIPNLKPGKNSSDSASYRPITLLPCLRVSLTEKFNIYMFQFREKWFKQNMKKTFRKNVFICEDFSLNRKENELHKKYGIFGGSTEKNKDPPILEIEENGWFHWI